MSQQSTPPKSATLPSSPKNPQDPSLPDDKQLPSDGPEDGAHPHGKPPLPHERDQSAHMTNGIPSPKVQQAAKDLARGLQDTSKAPEMERTYQRQKGG
ncbi:hypothetical protein [Variovorax sp. HJSM1_2]|uniref:hypothetical protein n=1 Tax=Variovorax sp. HJSM1_2 TaxID=3366263 RepID=UPI003BEC1B4F